MYPLDFGWNAGFLEREVNCWPDLHYFVTTSRKFGSPV